MPKMFLESFRPMTKKEIHKRIILVCTLGKTPQVLVETIWALANQEDMIVPDEIVAVSMNNFAEDAKDSIFGKGNGWRTLIEELRKAKIPIEGKLHFEDIIVAADDDGPIQDLRTVKDNARCANYLFMLLRKYMLDTDDAQIIVSLSGGRKSLAALVTSNMSLLARPQDRLVHLIADEKFENDKYHFPKKGLGYSLFEVPFVRTRDSLRGVSVDKANSFLECIEVTQGSIAGKMHFPELRLDVDRGVLQIEQKIIRNIDCPRFALLWLLFMRQGKCRGEYYDGILTIANKNNKLEFSALGSVPKWVEELHAKDKIVAFHRILDDTRRLLKKDKLLTPFQVNALLPRCKNSHTRFDELSYPLDKMIILNSNFSTALYGVISNELGWK